jgi:hypothetical protein
MLHATLDRKRATHSAGQSARSMRCLHPELPAHRLIHDPRAIAADQTNQQWHIAHQSLAWAHVASRGSGTVQVLLGNQRE